MMALCPQGRPDKEAIVTRNVGGIDRTIRIMLGIGLLGLLFVLEGGARWAGLIGLVPLGTALIGYCPLYSILGVTTSPRGSTPHRA
jgi:hypothetical protein